MRCNNAMRCGCSRSLVVLALSNQRVPDPLIASVAVGSLVPEQQKLNVRDIKRGLEYLQSIFAPPRSALRNDANQVGLCHDFGSYQKTGY